jgi:thiamine pyrophosphokinase
LSNGIILANGVFPTHIIPLTILKNTTQLICCDGAINELDNNNVTPTIIIGDCDSINEKFKNKYKSQILQINRQTDSDLEKALKYCIKEKINEIIILGFEGYRDDHYLSNIFLCWEYSKYLKISMNSNYGKFSFVKNQTTFKSFKGQQISIFNKEPKIKITTNNLKYNLNNIGLTNLYTGVSNESLLNTFSIKTNDITLMVYQNYKG